MDSTIILCFLPYIYFIKALLVNVCKDPKLYEVSKTIQTGTRPPALCSDTLYGRMTDLELHAVVAQNRSRYLCCLWFSRDLNADMLLKRTLM